VLHRLRYTITENVAFFYLLCSLFNEVQLTACAWAVLQNLPEVVCVSRLHIHWLSIWTRRPKRRVKPRKECLWKICYVYLPVVINSYQSTLQGERSKDSRFALSSSVSLSLYRTDSETDALACFWGLSRGAEVSSFVITPVALKFSTWWRHRLRVSKNIVVGGGL
jgi:hypothetical protein